jgi:hypothetical protein
MVPTLLIEIPAPAKIALPPVPLFAAPPAPCIDPLLSNLNVPPNPDGIFKA